MRLAVPDVDAARRLAQHWAGRTGPITASETVALTEAERALRAGRVDLAFVPTLAVLRDPEAFSVVPGVGLVGRSFGPVRLHLRHGFERVGTVGLDPRFAQEALLARVILKEHYGAEPQFVPLPDAAAAPADLDALLLPPGQPAPDEAAGLVLDLGREWFELTTRPMVWALVAAVAGGVEPAEAAYLRDAALDAFPDDDPDGLHTEEPAGVTLAAYAHAGLDAWVHHLYYHGALGDLPEIPFVRLPDEDAGEDDET